MDLNTFMNTILGTFKGGDTLVGMAKSLLMILLFIDFLLVSLMNIEHPDRIKLLIQQSLKIGAWIYVINNAYSWAIIVKTSLLEAGGIIAGGSSPDVFSDPGHILILGMSKITPIFNSVFTLDAGGPLDFIGKILGTSSEKGIVENIKTVAGAVVSPIGLLGKYIIGIVLYIVFFLFLTWALTVLTCQVFMAIIEFNIIASVAVILIPFGSFKWLSFVGERAIGAVWSSGIKLMVMQILMGFIMISLDSWQGLSPSGDVTGELISKMIGLCALAYVYVTLVKEVPSLVAGLLSGSPNLSAGDLASTAGSASGMANTAKEAAKAVLTKGRSMYGKLK